MKIIVGGILLFLFMAILSALDLAAAEFSLGYLIWIVVFIVLIVKLLKFLGWWNDL